MSTIPCRRTTCQKGITQLSSITRNIWRYLMRNLLVTNIIFPFMLEYVHLINHKQPVHCISFLCPRLFILTWNFYLYSIRWDTNAVTLSSEIKYIGISSIRNIKILTPIGRLSLVCRHWRCIR